MHFDLGRMGLFLILLAVIYCITNFLFATYYFINFNVLPLNILLDKKVFILTIAGIGLNWSYIKQINFNIPSFIKQSIFEGYQSIPFLILLSVVFVLPDINNLNKSQLIYEGFQLLTSLAIFLAIWKSNKK